MQYKNSRKWKEKPIFKENFDDDYYCLNRFPLDRIIYYSNCQYNIYLMMEFYFRLIEQQNYDYKKVQSIYYYGINNKKSNFKLLLIFNIWNILLLATVLNILWHRLSNNFIKIFSILAIKLPNPYFKLLSSSIIKFNLSWLLEREFFQRIFSLNFPLSFDSPFLLFYCLFWLYWAQFIIDL